MKSICIKTNKFKSIDYLLMQLEKIDIPNIYYSHLKFSNYNNIIIHYSELKRELLFKKLSDIFANLVISIYEPTFIKKIISHEYFYFDDYERTKIFENTTKLLEEDLLVIRKTLLYNKFYSYMLDNKKIILDGFIPFRIQDYLKYLVKKVDISVNKFLIDREYSEFISILKLYVDTESSTVNTVHLVYSESRATLLDEYKHIIKTDNSIFNAKYLSDITFSANDYALNTLLSILPQKIYIHLIDNTIDEFIHTLELIFEKRIKFCNDCDICNLFYKKNIKNFQNKNTNF